MFVEFVWITYLIKIFCCNLRSPKYIYLKYFGYTHFNWKHTMFIQKRKKKFSFYSYGKITTLAWARVRGSVHTCQYRATLAPSSSFYSRNHYVFTKALDDFPSLLIQRPTNVLISHGIRIKSTRRNAAQMVYWYSG